MRVQFSVNNDEWEKLQNLAKDAGYPDVPSYCKDTSLQDRTFGGLWKTVVEEISKMKPGKVFPLRELVPSPPSNLGRKLYEHQEELGIEVQEKDKLGSNTFKKL